MALIAEELVEEWLRRQGFFTIRGLKAGTGEMDLLAVRVQDHELECRHVEVSASTNPVSYICPLPKPIQKETGLGANSAKHRDEELIRASVKEWSHKKFHISRKLRIKQGLCAVDWTREFVVHRVRHVEEIDIIKEEGVTVHRLDDIIIELRAAPKGRYTTAGGDLVNLIVGLASPEEQDSR